MSGVRDAQDFDHIALDPTVMGGSACVRRLRVTIGMIVGQICAGRRPEDLWVDYPYLQVEDISQALRYAAWRPEEGEVLLAGGSHF